jgi:V8-like Glu-specific endopeptidase
MKGKSDVVDRALRHLPNLDSIEQRLEQQPHALLSAAFESTRPRPMAAPAPGPTPAPAGVGDIHTAIARVQDSVAHAARRAIAKVRTEGRDATLTQDEAVGLEAIILVTGRPALLIQGGTFQAPPPEWAHLDRERDNIQRTIQSVGRIEVTGHPELEWIGTGFLIAANVVMTNRHVAKEFCRQGARATWSFEPGMTARIDYAEEVGVTRPREFKLTGVIGVHEKYDLALLRASPRSARGKAPQPLTVSSDPSRVKKGRQVYVVGYPASDSRRNDPDVMRRIFANIYDVKRLQPGQVAKLLLTQALLHHDCSTLGGNSGSCVIDLETHQVVGLHFSGRYGVANQAVALARLTKDALLKKAKVNFA